MNLCSNSSTVRLSIIIIIILAGGVFLWLTHFNPYSTDLRQKAAYVESARKRGEAIIAQSKTWLALENVALSVSKEGELLISFSPVAMPDDEKALDDFLVFATLKLQETNAIFVRYLTPRPKKITEGFSNKASEAIGAPQPQR